MQSTELVNSSASWPVFERWGGHWVRVGSVAVEPPAASKAICESPQVPAGTSMSIGWLPKLFLVVSCEEMRKFTTETAIDEILAGQTC